MKIFLLGFMGSGKSFLAKRLAPALNMTFLDTDAIIENLTQLSISQIFFTFDESYFRFLENKVLFALQDFKNAVIATGGGLPCFYNNLTFIKTQGISFYLKTDLEILFQRLKKQKNERPLISSMNDDELKDFIIRTLEDRERKCYLQADFVIENNNEAEKNILQILEDVKV